MFEGNGPEVDRPDPSLAQALFEVTQEPRAHPRLLGIRPDAEDAEVEDSPDIRWLLVADLFLNAEDRFSLAGYRASVE